MKVKLFKSAADFRAWLETHGERETELWVGYHKKHTGKTSITYPESVDEALCFGWIDGIRKGVDDTTYTNRFTPRKPTSNWSPTNIKRVKELTKLGRMSARGLAVFAAGREYRAGRYSYEERSVNLPPKYAKIVKRNKAAWTHLQAQSEGQRKAVMWWIVSAKQETTRLRRLRELIDKCAAGRPLAQMVSLARPSATASRAAAAIPGTNSPSR